MKPPVTLLPASGSVCSPLPSENGTLAPEQDDEVEIRRLTVKQPVICIRVTGICNDRPAN